MIKLTIDKRPVEVDEGTTVLAAARKMGIRIPTLCYHESLTPYGGCRLCLVEIAGLPRPATSCTLPCSEGMVVTTDSENLKKLRQFSLQLILSEHPFSCLICRQKEDCAKYMDCIGKEPVSFGCKYCARNGSCELQKLVEELEIKDVPFAFRYRGLEVERQDPFFERDYNLCILCGRCVRTCEEIRGASVIDFHHRGPKTLVGTAYGISHMDASCQFCGACVDACPTGAMSERFAKWDGRPDRVVASACSLCGTGCDINVNVKEGKVISTTPRESDLCVRGRFGIAPMVNHARRAAAPLVKKDGRLVVVDWEEALELTASRMTGMRSRAGIVFSRQISCEAIDAVSCLSEISGIDAVGSTPGLHEREILDAHAVKPAAAKAALVVMAVDPVSDFQIELLRVWRAFKAPPLLVVIDPVRTRAAAFADIWLRPEPSGIDEFVNVLLTKRADSAVAGVAKQDIIDAKKLLAGREIYVMYDPAHGPGIGISRIKHIHALPMVFQPNLLKCLSLNTFDMGALAAKNPFDMLYLIGATPALASPCKTLIVQDCFVPDTDFDVFLPAAMPTEFDGSFINNRGKLKVMRKAVEPAGKAMPDEWIIKEVTARLSDGGTGRNPVRIPPPGTADKPSKPSKKFPYYLIVRENTYRFRDRSLSSLLKGFRRVRHDQQVWINPQDAKAIGLQDGATVKLTGERFTAVVRLRMTENVPPGALMTYQDLSAGIAKDTVVRIDV